MSIYLRASGLALIASLTLACSESTSPEAENASTVAAESPPALGAWPMPRLESRIAAALEEIGPEVDALRADLEMNGGRLRKNRRRVLKKLSPRARGVLRRHRVRLVHLAKYLNRGRR